MSAPVLYARSGDLSIAYQVVGEGPADVLMIPGWFSHLALDWEEPTLVRWVERLAAQLASGRQYTETSIFWGHFPTLAQTTA